MFSVQIYLDDMSRLQEVNGIHKEYFKSPMPARTTVQVAKLSLGAHIETEGPRVAIAHFFPLLRGPESAAMPGSSILT